MRLETKKMIALALTIINVAVTATCVALVCVFNAKHDAGPLFEYIFCSLIILATFTLIAWVPRLRNKRYTFRTENGKLRIREKHTNEFDRSRSRLVLIPPMTLFFEISLFMDRCVAIWGTAALKTTVTATTLAATALLATWVLTNAFAEYRRKSNS